MYEYKSKQSSPNAQMRLKIIVCTSWRLTTSNIDLIL